jgi:DHA1 family putative efflux transporter-like MFS transporter
MKNLGIYLLTIGTFLTGTSEMVVAGIVNMIANDLKITISLAGQMVTTFSLAFAIGTPIIVSMTSRLERKKVLLGSLGVFLVGNLVSFFSSSFAILLGARVILGTSAGVFIVVAMSVASRLVPSDKIGNAISTVSLGFGTALVLGVPLGAVLSEWLGWRSIFVVLAILSFLIMIPLARLIPSLEGENAIPLSQQLSIIKNRKLLSGLFIFFSLITGYGASYTYLTPFLQESIHLDMSTISLSMFVFGVFSTVGTRFGGYGADKWGASRTISYSIFFHAILLIFLPLVTNSIIATLMIAAVWVGVSNITIPALQTYFIHLAPESSDLALSASSSVAQLGLAVGAGLGGLFLKISETSIYNPWLSAVVVILSFVAAIVTFFISPRPVSGQ